MFNTGDVIPKLNCFLLIIISITVILVLYVAGGCASPVAEYDIGMSSRGIDTDKDGLSDEHELAFKTDPKNPDTDNDGLSDGYEIDMDLDPVNPDIDGDGILDADDFLPKINNGDFYLFIGIMVLIIILACIGWYHLKRGLTDNRREAVKAAKIRQQEEDEFFQQVRGKIEELAEDNYGWLSLNETSTALGLEINIAKRFFKRLKAKKKGELYCFKKIVKTVVKK